MTDHDRAPAPATRRARQAGLSLVELVVATGVLSLVCLGIGAVMSGGASNTKLLRVESALVTKAQEVLDACRVLRFGDVDDNLVTSVDVREVFDGDPYMGPDRVTLHGVRTFAAAPVNQGKIVLKTKDTNYFPDGFAVDGKFIVRVAKAGTVLMTRAVTADPSFATKLKNSQLDNGDAIRISVLFRDDQTGTERFILSTVMTSETGEGGTP